MIRSGVRALTAAMCAVALIGCGVRFHIAAEGAWGTEPLYGDIRASLRSEYPFVRVGAEPDAENTRLTVSCPACETPLQVRFEQMLPPELIERSLVDLPAEAYIFLSPTYAEAFAPEDVGDARRTAIAGRFGLSDDRVFITSEGISFDRQVTAIVQKESPRGVVVAARADTGRILADLGEANGALKVVAELPVRSSGRRWIQGNVPLVGAIVWDLVGALETVSPSAGEEQLHVSRGYVRY